MQRKSSKVAIVGAVFVVIVGLTIVIRGDEALKQRTGFPQDWSHSHLIFSNPGSFAQAVRNGSVANWYKIMNEPRYQMQQVRRNVATLQPNAAALKNIALKPAPPKPAPPKSTPIVKDWNFSLQTNIQYGGVSYGRFPAKYSFNETGASCTNDFIIYGLNVQGSSTQANLVGVNNLYVGAAGGGGCGSPSGSNGGAGTAPTPEVEWAFNVASGAILTDVVLSLDGKKVAYVVNSSPAVLHVLTLGTGTVGNTCGSAVCSVANPATPGNASEAPGSSLATVTLTGSTGDYNSSPYVDYGNDVGYVGDNAGHLFKITGFFHGTPTIASNWPVSAGSGGSCSSPVYDGATSTVFIGCADGKLYGYTTGSSPSQISGSPLTLAVSGGSQQFGLLAPAIVDSTNHVLYAFYGDNAITTLADCTTVGSCPEVAQVVFTSTPTFSASTTAALTTAGTNPALIERTNPAQEYITEGAFNQSYFSSGPSSTSFLNVCGTNSGSDPVGVSLQQFNFNGSGILQSLPVNVGTINTTVTQSGITNLGAEICSPLTEFYNTNGTATDYLFLSVPALSSSNLFAFKIPSAGSWTFVANSTVADGSSGIVVDGADPTTNASSLYFTSQGTATCTDSSDASPANTGIGSIASAICAYKLTQSALQ